MPYPKLSKWIKHAALTTGCLFSIPNINAAEVDLLIVYDNQAAARFNGDPTASMVSWVDNMNKAYVESQVDIQLRLVGVEFFDSQASGMSDKLTEIRRSSTVANLRDQTGADYVSLLSMSDRNICGIGYLAVSSAYAFNVTGANCGYLTMAHELGHNMGLSHSRRQGDNAGARYRYGLGYGVDGLFSTIMAYPQAFGTRNRLNRFSDPNRECQGVTCGVAVGTDQEADAHRALNNVKDDIANFRQSAGGGGGVGGGGGTDPDPGSGTNVPAPSNLNANAESSSVITLSWNDNSTGEDDFQIQRSTSSNSGFSQIGTAGRGSRSYTDNNLEANTQYFYRVRARLSGNNSEWSNTTNATTLANAGPEVPTANGLGINLANQGFSQFTSQVGSDAASSIKDNGATITLENNYWLASSETFNITTDTVLHFDFSANNTGEIHGIGFDEDTGASSNRIFKLSGTQDWGLTEYTYTGNGSPQSFSIPVGQFYTGTMKLVLTNDNDAASGNISHFSNIRLTGSDDSGAEPEPTPTPTPVPTPTTTPNPTQTPGPTPTPTPPPTTGNNYQFGLDYVSDTEATLYHLDNGQAANSVYLCINRRCAEATKVGNRYELSVNISPGRAYSIGYWAFNQCLTVASVEYTAAGGGVKQSACF